MIGSLFAVLSLNDILNEQTGYCSYTLKEGSLVILIDICAVNKSNYFQALLLTKYGIAKTAFRFNHRTFPYDFKRLVK